LALEIFSSVLGKWKMCSIHRQQNISSSNEENTFLNTQSFTPSTLPESNCSSHVQRNLQLFCNDKGCASYPFLMCLQDADRPNAAKVTFLNDTVCTQRANVCHGIEDSLRANDHGSFDALGHRAVIQGLIWFFAITAIAGNSAVIYRCMRLQATRFKSMMGTEKVHHFLVVNLALSDFLMGFYVTLYGIGHGNHHHEYSDEHRYQWLCSTTCLTMGVLSLCSCQMSMTMLIIITTFRLASVVKPFADQNKRLTTAVAITLFSWAFWTMYALIPLISSSTINNAFYDYVKINSLSCFKQSDMHRDYLTDVMHEVERFVGTECGRNARDLYTLPKRLDWEDLLEFGRKLNIFDPNDDPKFFGYYNKQSVCTAKYFVTYGSGSMFYTLAVVLYDCAAFLYISSAYIFMWKKTSRRKSLRRLACLAGPECPTLQATAPLQRRDRENRRMHVQIMVIIATNFLCWIPICSLSIYHFIKSSSFAVHGCEFHRYTSKWSARVSILTMVLLPINSSVNPFIYSFRYWGRFKKQVVDKFRRSSTRSP